MNFERAIVYFDTLLENGPLGTRLAYDYELKASSDLTESEEGRQALKEIYEGDLAVAQHYGLPIILNAATYRASANHLEAANLNTPKDILRINSGCVDFIQTIKKEYSTSSTPIFIGAPLGSMYDAYSVESIPSVSESQIYHQDQINIFKDLEVDFVNVITLPSLSEALGIALAADNACVNYTIGFILNKAGTLLDGTSFEEAIQAIDSTTIQKPLGYLITCTHASVIEKLTLSPESHERLIGIQPNGSCLTPEELAGMTESVADLPEKFTDDIMSLKSGLNLKIVGGCCGTTRDHLLCLAQTCSSPGHHVTTMTP